MTLAVSMHLTSRDCTGGAPGRKESGVDLGRGWRPLSRRQFLIVVLTPTQFRSAPWTRSTASPSRYDTHDWVCLMLRVVLRVVASGVRR
jgi:hypothetical protein